MAFYEDREERRAMAPPQLRRWKALVAGASGGLIASLAMSEFHSLFPHVKRQSQPAGEDSTIKTASAISQAIFQHRLTAAQKEIAGPVVHYAFGTTMGALYGVLVDSRDARHLGWGLPFGTAIWLGAHVITVPALGLSEPITREVPAAEAVEFASHLVYGAVVEGVRRTLRKYLLR
jgi:putative membrane protein